MSTSQKPQAQQAAANQAQRTVNVGDANARRTFTYTMNKGYPDSHKGKTITWEVPTTIAAILASGAAPDEQTIAEVFVRQFNILRGHKVQAAVLAKDVKPEDVTLDKLTALARSTNFGKIAGERVKGGKTAEVKAKAERAERIQSAAMSKIQTYDEATLRSMLDVGVYTEEQVKAELARRKNTK